MQTEPTGNSTECTAASVNNKDGGFQSLVITTKELSYLSGYGEEGIPFKITNKEPRKLNGGETQGARNIDLT